MLRVGEESVRSRGQRKSFPGEGTTERRPDRRAGASSGKTQALRQCHIRVSMEVTKIPRLSFPSKMSHSHSSSATTPTPLPTHNGSLFDQQRKGFSKIHLVENLQGEGRSPVPPANSGHLWGFRASTGLQLL